MHIAPEDIRTCIEDHPAREPGVEPMATPIVQTSLFAFPDYDSLIAAGAAEYRNNVYTRGQNPTVEVLERKLAALERGESCKAFGSGMAAVSSVILGLLDAGDHILFVNHTYGPTMQLAKQLGYTGLFSIEANANLTNNPNMPDMGADPHAWIADLLRSCGFSTVEKIGEAQSYKREVNRALFKAIP